MAEIVSRIYSNFRGVDFRGDEINLIRSPDALNVWKDYKETESIRTRPGTELVVENKLPVYDIFFYKDELLFTSLNGLHRVVNGEAEQLRAFSNGWKTFVFNDYLYFLGGGDFFYYDGDTTHNVEGYIPTTSIGRSPSGGGTIYEDVNMLSDYRINTFLADGESTEYHLDATNIDSDFTPIVTYNGKNYSFIEEVDYENGVVKLMAALEPPATDGQDNVSIKFRKTVNKDTVMNCTLVQVFDNRVFISGNPDKPNTVWHCSLNDPTYWSDLDYYVDGVDSTPIRGLVAGNNALWVFREPSDSNTTVFYHTPTIDDEYGKIYPSAHSSVTTGCVGGAINFNDDIVFFSERGMEGISGDITTEQVIAHRSTLVDRKLTAEENYKNMILAEWEGYLLVCIDNRVYLADSRAVFSNEGHKEYEWFYWELEGKVHSATVHDGDLYLGLEIETDAYYPTCGVYKLTDKTANVESYWTTPKDKFEYPHKLKTTNKRGCVAEATGDISVYVKVEDTDFEHIGTYEGITDYFVSRIKRKKWKDIQMKFHTNTRFSLETVTLESFVGGYIKR